MCEILDNFDFTSADAESLSKLVKSVTSFLTKAEAHYAKTVLDLSQNAEDATPKEDTKSIAGKVEHREDFLDSMLLQKLKEELPTLPYQPTGRNKPRVCLLGEQRYAYSKATENLAPQPVSSVVSDVLDCVNERFGIKYNSVLVNRYANKNVALGWHQDNEDVIDQSVPIMTLSVGASRRFWIADSPSTDKRTQLAVEELKENSILVMKPGLQKTHYHKVDTGRGSLKGERGERFSLTFRQLVPPLTSLPVTDPGSLLEDKKSDPCSDNQHRDCHKCLVFGSSLTKGLKEHLLSRRGKRFAVFSNSGAHIGGIMQDMFDVADDKTVCRKCVDTIFFVCAGNDTENGRTEDSPQRIADTYGTLLEYTGCIFPNAVLNVVSLLPRRLRFSHHMQHMVSVNNKLSVICEGNETYNFINIFSYFLKDKKAFFESKFVNSFSLNKKLFTGDNLHLSYIGNSVLGKVIIGATYNPY